MERWTSDPFELPEREEGARVDFIFYAVDHGGQSYEARVFVNNEEADADTPRDPDYGYAGSYTVFGHAGCYGDEGHCDVHQGYRDEFDVRLQHPLTPLTKVVIADDAALRRAEGGKLVVTVVAVSGAERVDVHFEHVRLATYIP